MGNYRSAPILIDTAHDTLGRQSSYYHIGHIARFVKPGARRVLCAATREDLEVAAFVNPDGSTVVVVLNRICEAISFALRISGSIVNSEMPPRSMASYLDSGGQAGSGRFRAIDAVAESAGPATLRPGVMRAACEPAAAPASPQAAARGCPVQESWKPGGRRSRRCSRCRRGPQTAQRT